MMPNTLVSTGLTGYAPASVRELLSLSFPLMIASLSGLLMNFCDRLFLAHYSIDAMNAAVTAGMTANLFTYGAVEIVIIAEVFVGKCNGAQDFYKAAQPVWQMVWFSLATAVIYVPCGLFLAPVLVPEQAFLGQAMPYFSLWMMFGFLFPLASALSAFFIGIGHVKIVTFTILLSNIANAVLDYVLIFGLEGYFSPLGVRGAVIATIMAQSIQVIVFAFAFFTKTYRMRYRTARPNFSWALFKDCFLLGAPNALGHMIEIGGWALIMRLLTAAGDEYITVLAMGQNLHILFAFISQGLQKGVIAVGSNIVGAKAYHLMNRLMRSSMMVLVMVALILSIPLVLYPDLIMELFLHHADGAQQNIFDMSLKTGFFVWCFIIFDSVVWNFASMLTVHGDTKFIMVANALAAWFLAVLPIFVVVFYFKAPPYFSWVIINTYAIINAGVFYVRWRKINRDFAP